jgi:hypothetical protein
MKKQDFKIVLLRAFAHQIRSFADFMLAHTEEEEHTNPEGDSTNQDVEEMSASWPTTIEADAPPAHWLERVRQGAPELLEQRDSPRQQALRNVPDQRDILYEKHHGIRRDGMVKLHPTNSIHTAIPSSEPDHDATASGAVGADVHPQPPSPSTPLAEADAVGADVHPRPRWPLTPLDVGAVHPRPRWPLAPLDEQDDVGADVHPRPRWPMTPSPSRSFSPTLRIRDNSRESGEEGRDEHQPLRRSFPDSPPTNQTRSRRDLSAWTSETYPQMRWPSLPQEEATEQQSWEMMRRSWERQQRLNEEQRGVSWNA